MPKLKVEPIKATTVSTADVLRYDSGVLYDDPDAYYDLMYPYDSDTSQGEIPKVFVGDEPKKAKVGIESVIIKETRRTIK